MSITIAAAGGAGALFSGFGINIFAFLSQLISFGVIFFVLWKFGFPVIIKTLEKRQAIIREGIENAERAKIDLENATRRAEEQMLNAQREAQAVIEKAQKIAEEEGRRIVEEARVRAEQEEKRQIERIQQEAARARAEISRLVVNLSISAASKVISKSVDNRDNRRLIEEFVSSASQTREQ